MKPWKASALEVVLSIQKLMVRLQRLEQVVNEAILSSDIFKGKDG